MEVGSSTEMGAPGASHLGTGDHGPKPTEQTTISPGNAHGACIVPVPCDREIVTPCRLERSRVAADAFACCGAAGRVDLS
jgi:hypothetical protein